MNVSEEAGKTLTLGELSAIERKKVSPRFTLHCCFV